MTRDLPPSLTPCSPCSCGDHADCESDSPEKPIGANPCPCWVIGHSTRFYGGEDRRMNHWSAGTPGPPRGGAWQENVLATAAAVADDRAELIAAVAENARVSAEPDTLRATVELVLIEFATRMVTPRGPQLVESRQPQDAP